jgi:hypothetical protein
VHTQAACLAAAIDEPCHDDSQKKSGFTAPIAKEVWHRSTRQKEITQIQIESKQNTEWQGGMRCGGHRTNVTLETNLP